MTAPVETSLRTLPCRWYTDPCVAEIERDRIFRRTCQYAGHPRRTSARTSSPRSTARADR